MFACNRCNQLAERTGYCENCGSPESRELKDQKRFLAMAPDQPELIVAVQQCCAEAWMEPLINFAGWEFCIEQNKTTGWYCAYTRAPFEVHSELMKLDEVARMGEWMTDYIEKERFKDVGEDLSEDTD